MDHPSPGASRHLPPAGEERHDRRIDAAIGVIGGLAGGLLGVGGGFVMVPLQVIWAKRTQHRATGMSLAAILPIGVAAAAVYCFGRSSPQSDLVVAFFLAVGGVGGAFLGSLAGRRISDRVLSMIFAILLFGVGLKEVYDAFGGAAPQLVGTVVRALSVRDYALITVGGVEDVAAPAYSVFGGASGVETTAWCLN